MKLEFLQIRIDAELLNALRKQAERHDKPVSVYVREAIREKLARERPAEIVPFPAAEPDASENHPAEQPAGRSLWHKLKERAGQGERRPGPAAT